MPKKNRHMPLRITDQFMTEIDDFRRIQSDLPTRAEAVRRLVELGLRVAKEARENAGKSGKKSAA